WQSRLRWFLRLKPSEKIPGLIWFRLITWLLIWLGFGLVVLRFWGLSETGFALVTQYLIDGFRIGDLPVVPSKVFTGLLVFALLLSVVRWGRNTADLKLQQHTQLDAGARDALSSGILYAGFAAAILVGLSFVGVDFTKLAIIAGALSVGIGFGLQNVVSNFVSGIILLVERPVRPGDWIIIGNTQGFVTKVRVRATEIRTFDRSDVIVPNSLLLSEQVTNWTLRDAYRRIIIPIGVAYGSDLQRVKDCLLKVAREHEEVVQDGSDLAPQAFFISFEDNGLKFELRCFVHNAMRALSVTSDINFAIDKAFREAGIQIPFPHREVIIRGELPKT
ncbi:MAG TPA: mechanosensitive ion channel domain-containing protein, partial [Gammaproteobacteria bacterium]